jgi:hypothetical protein
VGGNGHIDQATKLCDSNDERRRHSELE